MAVSVMASLEAAEAAYLAGDYETALVLAKQVYEDAIEENDTQLQATASFLCGRVLFHHGKLDAACTMLQDAVVNFEIVGDRVGQGRALSFLGATYRQMGDLALSLDTHLHELAIFEGLNNKREQARALNGIAGIYHYMNQTNEAIETLKRAQTLLSDVNDLQIKSAFNTNMIVLYARKRDFDTALKVGDETWAMLESLGLGRTPHQEAQTLIFISEVHRELEHYDKALEILRRALNISRQHHLRKHEIEALIELGKLAHKQKNTHNALDYWRQALNLGDTLDLNEWHYETHFMMAQEYEAIGDFENALRCYKLFHQVKEARFNLESDQRIRLLEVRHRTESAAKEVEFYRHQAQQSEHQREQDRTYFQRLNKLRDEILAATSHDLKNPVSSIKMSSYLIRRTQHGGLDKWLDNIDLQVGRINELITHTLELAKLETGRALLIERCEIAPLLTVLVAHFHMTAEAQNISFTLDKPKDNIAAYCDPVLFRQALENLISNALKYTKGGGKVTLSIEKRGEYAAILIRDTGVGIPPSELPYIFDRFYRVNQGQQREIDGTGLGLAIVKTIIDQHSGKMLVESEVGQGTMFTVLLPLAYQEA